MNSSAHFTSSQLCYKNNTKPRDNRMVEGATWGFTLIQLSYSWIR